MLESLMSALGWACLLLAALPVLYFTVITLGALLPRRSGPVASEQLRLAIVIPAHNEGMLIANTVKVACAQQYPQEKFTVVVVADNCSDDTAAVAAAAGARVLERHTDAGKGQALHHAFTTLIPEGWDACLVIDADSLLQDNALQVLNDELSAGARVVQIRGGIRNPGDSVRTRAMELGMASYNGLRPAGKTALGLSCSISGNGFCISSQTLIKVPYLAHSIVEDIEYHLHLLAEDIKVVFTDRTSAPSQMPVTAAASKSQRVRWEQGRMLMIKKHAGPLLRRTLSGDWNAFEGLLDVLTPPASLIVLPLAAALLLGDSTVRLLALLMFVLLGGHYLLASWRYGSLLGLFRVALFLPWYITWKTYVVLVSLIKRQHSGWVRTSRHQADD